MFCREIDDIYRVAHLVGQNRKMPGKVLGSSLRTGRPGRRTARSQDRKMPWGVLRAILRTGTPKAAGPQDREIAKCLGRYRGQSCELVRSCGPAAFGLPVRKIDRKTFPGILRSCDIAVRRPGLPVRKIDPNTFPGILRYCGPAAFGVPVRKIDPQDRPRHLAILRSCGPSPWAFFAMGSPNCF